MATTGISPREFEKTFESFEEQESTVASGPPVPSTSHRSRPVWLVPTLLLLATLLSMAWVGITAWSPLSLLLEAFDRESLFIVRQHILANWVAGLQFSISLALILGAHELGHYFVTRSYGIPSTLPLFLPFPISPIGTCGAVIMMDGGKADRKEIFDIGIAGPLAGLLFAIPIAAIGLMLGTPPETTVSSLEFGQPLILQWIDYAIHGSGPVLFTSVSNSSMNPMVMAAWVGFLITGINMIPVSQLDGGHVLFGLLGSRSKRVAWIVYLACAAYVIYAGYRYKQSTFVVMLLLVPLLGITHPPSRNDDVPLGLWRNILGYSSLLIPFLCIPTHPFVFLGP